LDWLLVIGWIGYWCNQSNQSLITIYQIEKGFFFC
jgi:hypothetical protein